MAPIVGIRDGKEEKAEKICEIVMHALLGVLVALAAGVSERSSSPLLAEFQEEEEEVVAEQAQGEAERKRAEQAAAEAEGRRKSASWSDDRGGRLCDTLSLWKGGVMRRRRRGDGVP